MAQLIEEIDALHFADKHDEVLQKLRRTDGDYNNMELELIWRLARGLRFSSTFLKQQCSNDLSFDKGATR